LCWFCQFLVPVSSRFITEAAQNVQGYAPALVDLVEIWIA
jgi:hypothetical protein